jgi:hypothetical protein
LAHQIRQIGSRHPRSAETRGTGTRNTLCTSPPIKHILPVLPSFSLLSCQCRALRRAAAAAHRLLQWRATMLIETGCEYFVFVTWTRTMPDIRPFPVFRSNSRSCLLLLPLHIFLEHRVACNLDINLGIMLILCCLTLIHTGNMSSPFARSLNRQGCAVSAARPIVDPSTHLQ